MSQPPTGSPAPVDPEASWPPRFGERFLLCSASLLMLLFAGAVWLLDEAFDGVAPATGGGRSMRDVTAYTLFVLGALSLLAGVFFALVEARKRLEPTTTTTATTATTTPTGTRAGEGGAPAATEVLTKTVDALSGRKVSVILFALAFTFIAFGASASGLISLSIGSDTATPTPSVTPTP